MKVIIKYFPDGYRAALQNGWGKIVDTTVDVYPTIDVLISRIKESKTWFENLEENPSQKPEPYKPLRGV